HGAGKAEQGVQVEEGGDMDFQPDHLVKHGDIIRGENWTVECVYTPGHTSNHLCFALQEQRALFTGDHVMGWSTSIISPPDGDMAAYMDSLQLLLERDDKVYWPTHGPSIIDPKTHVQAYIDHRLNRERQILLCIEQGTHQIRDMVPLIYKDTPEFMYPAAARSVLAAIENLLQKEQIRKEGEGTAMDKAYYLA
ncbi:MAG: MBL fold metallo-hydrolase, partial [Pseudomonadota bacterium]|nr:MBL fold metallo-hydrolase [Pseudomonadota bacterium]